jgi:hypothetical protein
MADRREQAVLSRRETGECVLHGVEGARQVPAFLGAAFWQGHCVNALAHFSGTISRSPQGMKQPTGKNNMTTNSNRQHAVGE